MNCGPVTRHCFHARDKNGKPVKPNGKPLHYECCKCKQRAEDAYNAEHKIYALVLIDDRP